MVYVLMADGFEEIEALTVVDLLRRNDIPVKTASCNGSMTVTGAHDIQVNTDIKLSNVSVGDMEMIVLPGGMPGTTNLLLNEMVVQLLDYAYKHDKYLAAICAAPMVLGELGILNGKFATCYPGFESHLKGATVLDKNVVQDGKITTSKGMGTAIEFALQIVSLFHGNKAADATRKSIQFGGF